MANNLIYENICHSCGATRQTADDPGKCACGDQMALGRCVSPLWSNSQADTMNPTLNPADGKTYDSRTKYLSAVERAGCHVIEKDSRPKRMRQIDRSHADVARAYDEVTTKRKR